MDESNIDLNNPVEPYAQRRMEICRQCENYTMFICKQCGCFMPAKTRLRGAHCPIGKWQAEN